MLKRTFDRFGFDKDGYNKEGYDRMGYDRQGYDRQGFNKQGINIQGINKLTGYDKDGFDIDGFNENGLDREGYNRDGFNEEGYDRNGYDKDGFDFEGYNENGFNRIGYNKWGFDVNGFDKEGFDYYGFNKKGYDREGYNKAGYDVEGYNREGFDLGGYNKAGFDKFGYDRDGYDLYGYNSDGYDRDGFNKQGYDHDGYDKEGYNAIGFNEDGYYRNGFNINGISKDGRNVLGYDEDGFDENGFSIDGYSKEVFDEQGFNIYTGYNLNGFDRDGYNINGYDSEGYDRLGFHSITGYNRSGFDAEGYDVNGYNKEGYDRNKLNREGYDREGYDKDGYNEHGYDRNGYNREGYNRLGYDVNGYDENGALSPELRKKKSNTKMDPLQDALEAAYFKKCEKQIKGYYRNQVKKEVMKDYTPITREYIDRWGFLQKETKEPDIARAEKEIDDRVNMVLREPYFTHIDYKDNSELYLGKQAVHGWITDWADERASLYYQYKMYIGNKKTGLHFVRDIFFKKSKYNGYKDKYNVNAGSEEINESTDTYLLQIIKANQNNKRIHDIVESIQRNQYNIITSEKDKEILVLGCAGSGKTMILMHKIRYMKYNNPDLKMSDIMVISPTDVLGRESKELSKLLQIERVKQFTTASFYEKMIKELFLKLNLTYEAFYVVDEDMSINNYYEKTYLDNLVLSLNSEIYDPLYLKQQQKEIQNELEEHIALSNHPKKTITKMHKLYIDSIKEIRKAGRKDIERIIRQIDREVRNRELTEDVIDILKLLEDQKCFSGTKEKLIEELHKEFTYTRKLIQNMDRMEFIRTMWQIKMHTESAIHLIQVIQLFMSEKLSWEEIQKIIIEWEELSSKDVSNYIDVLKKELVQYDRLERKKEILYYLLEKDIIANRPLEDKSFTYNQSFEKLLSIYDELGESFEKIGFTPFSYFEQYEKLERRKNRLKEQGINNTRRNYLYDAILKKLDINYDKAEDIIVPKSKAFAMVYILSKYAGNVNTEKKYVYIDEFQDFSPLELAMIKDLFPKAITNFFGDIRQCINEKGIKSLTDIPNGLYTEKYQINENYRNAKQITNYVKTELGIEMLPVGLDGKMEIVNRFPDISIAEDDRVAVIVKDTGQFRREYNIDQKINYYLDSKEIIRGILNVIPIFWAKGLEFEKVVLIQDGMSQNEYYVGCTRAISELYVVKKSNDDMKIIDSEEKSVGDKKIEIQVESETDESEKIVQPLFENQDFSRYKLVPFEGKLKKITGLKNIPSTYIIVQNKNDQEKRSRKSIQIYYIKEMKCAYVISSIYKQNKKALDSYFASNEMKMNISKTDALCEENLE